jgi:alpha-tubulin suppressor-like RCC1 family protein
MRPEESAQAPGGVAGKPVATARSRLRRLPVVTAALVLLAPALALLGSAGTTAAVTTGPVYVWGADANGEAGTGTTSPDTTPVEAQLPTGVDATAVAGGSNYSLALTSTGSIYGWGQNNSGQLGNGTEVQDTTPTLVSLPQGVTATQIAAGSETSYAVTSSHQLYAWGNSSDGELGNSSLQPSLTPTLISLPAPVTQVEAGGVSA